MAREVGGVKNWPMEFPQKASENEARASDGRIEFAGDSGGEANVIHFRIGGDLRCRSPIRWIFASVW